MRRDRSARGLAARIFERMSRRAAVAIGVLGVILVTGLIALVLGREPALDPVSPPPSVADAPPTAPPPATEPVSVTPSPSPTRSPITGPEAAPPPVATPTATGVALVEQVREVVRRGEGAADAAAEQAAARDLSRVLADLEARGEAALPDARLLIARDAPPGVQEVGARVLARIGTVPALEALAELARGGAAGPARLQALRALRASTLPFARGALLDVALDRGADVEVRAYALDLMRDVAGAESTLHDIAADREEAPQVRAVALDALLALDPARGRAVLAEVGADEALRPYLEALRQR